MFGYQEYRCLLILMLTLFCDIGLNGLFVVIAVAVDEDNGFIYWSDGGLIRQSSLDGTYIKDVVQLHAGKLNMM